MQVLGRMLLRRRRRLKSPGRAFINSNPTPLWLLAATQTLTQMSGLRFVLASMYPAALTYSPSCSATGKLRHAAAARVVVVVQLGAVQQRQAHIKVCVDKVDDGASSPRRASRWLYQTRPNLP